MHVYILIMEIVSKIDDCLISKLNLAVYEDRRKAELEVEELMNYKKGASINSTIKYIYYVEDCYCIM